MTDRMTKPTTGEVLPYVGRDHRKPPFTICPGCGQDAYRIALVKIAYVFEVCECGDPGYPHLVEQFWHRDHIGRVVS
jgi:hypothetical protein